MCCRRFPPQRASSASWGSSIAHPPPLAWSGVSRVSELQDLCGPGTVASMPEAVAALSTGARELVVSDVAGGTAATATLMNSAEAPAVRLRARSRGAWANQLSVDVGTVTNADGKVVRVTVRILQNDQEVERFDDLIVEPGQPLDLFSVLNAQSNYVVAVEPSFDGKDPKPGTYPLGAEGSVAVEQKDAVGTVLMDVKLKPGAPSDGVAVTISGEGDELSLEVRRNGARQELFESLTMDPDSARHLPALLSALSRFVRVVPRSSLGAELRLPRATPAPVALAGGASPNVAAYRAAIDLLSDDPRIDLVMACFDPALKSDDVIQIHQALLAHALVASDAGAPRIAFGSIRGADSGNLDADPRSRCRGAQPAVRAGRPARRDRRRRRTDRPDQPARSRQRSSPRQLLGIPPSTYRESELNVLLGPTINLLVVQHRAGHGVIVLKGIDTIGDQISVTRVADRCIRETKAISENFIGRLNSADAREALKQQIIATFTRMERSGALVPAHRRHGPGVPRRRLLDAAGLRAGHRPRRHRSAPGPGHRLRVRHHPRQELGDSEAEPCQRFSQRPKALSWSTASPSTACRESTTAPATTAPTSTPLVAANGSGSSPARTKFRAGCGSPRQARSSTGSRETSSSRSSRSCATVNGGDGHLRRLLPDGEDVRLVREWPGDGGVRIQRRQDAIADTMPNSVVTLDLAAGVAQLAGSSIAVRARPGGALYVGGRVIRPLSFGERWRVIDAASAAESPLGATVLAHASEPEAAGETQPVDDERAQVIALHLAGARPERTVPGFAAQLARLLAAGWAPRRRARRRR